MNILLVDDTALDRRILSDYLVNQLGHSVISCEDGIQACECFSKDPTPLVISDFRMPGCNGIELLKRIKSTPAGELTDVVLITGHGDLDTAIAALRGGAYDYLRKPINLLELTAVVQRVLEHQRLLRDNIELTSRFEARVAEATRETEERLERIRSAYAGAVGIGRIGIFSERMRDVIDMAQRLHQDRSVPVLIEGETGTGKEIIARLVHFGAAETAAPFVTINCSAIAPTLFESELFGYEGGAFTGAKKSGQIGKLELAAGGTLFLDEIGDMPLELQPKLLRVLQEREFYRVGGLKNNRLDVRIICATNRDLDQMVESGAFRRDLFYRLNVGMIRLAPLRQRQEDIVPLAEMFLRRLSEQKKRKFKDIDPAAASLLVEHEWPGNVRELQNAMERVVLLYDDARVRPEHLNFLRPQDVLEQAGVGRNHRGLLEIAFPEESCKLAELEKRITQHVLEMFDGNKTMAAKYLDITRNTLRSKLGDP
ncbi:sigma-54 dependent transcriptional regulator [bacterium]|nr:sigma-54 dependent transcriptional regulator [bacterium]